MTNNLEIPVAIASVIDQTWPGTNARDRADTAYGGLLGLDVPPAARGSTARRIGGSWSVMDFAAGSPPLGDLNGIAALRRAPALFTHLPVQLATAMGRIHAIDPEPVDGATVICHGDLHPFNLLVDERGAVIVIDWTAAACAPPV